MKKSILKKYKSYPKFHLPDRTWPDNLIEKAPAWCSVDLRDGNQALITPMNLAQKLEFFKLLIAIGFKEIEVGFPSAADVEYKFLRKLIDDKLIPDDVYIQILTQAREHLIKKSFEAIKGAKNVVFHMYNSTSIAQRKMVFKKEKEAIKKIALDGIQWIKKYKKSFTGNLILEYSPESFTGTETDYALDVCEAVIDKWDSDDKVIINLPSTVEHSSPNIYADQIEWFIKNLKDRKKAIISLHTHNDRGTGVAATELGLLAGAERVEGTLFGNGERTGNVDIITLALNLFSHGIEPKLDLDNIFKVREIYEKCTNIPVHPRHPYAGDLVFTAFSGSHQDAINKGMAYHKKHKCEYWEVPYLPIDPSDLGRTYEAIIRINSQSGKGGVAWIMENEFGCSLPKAMHPEFGLVIQKIADKTGKELNSDTLWQVFSDKYLKINKPLTFIAFHTTYLNNDEVECTLDLKYQGKAKLLAGKGNGPIDACKKALFNILPTFSIVSYHEHSLGKGSGAKAIAYIQVEFKNKQVFGVGVDTNINVASIKALISALNRAFL